MNENASNTQRIGVVGRIYHLLEKLPYAYLAMAQGVFYFSTGAWPLFSIASFQAVTGPKTDIWLVKTIGLLLVVIGIALFTAGIRWRVTLEIFLLGIGTAASLAIIEVVYVFKGRISPVYLVDFFLELILIGWWISLYVRGFANPEVCSLFDPTFVSSKPGERE
jgi:hypothetical protein